MVKQDQLVKAISINELTTLLNLHVGSNIRTVTETHQVDIRDLTRRGYIDEKREVTTKGHKFIKAIKSLSHTI